MYHFYITLSENRNSTKPSYVNVRYVNWAVYIAWREIYLDVYRPEMLRHEIQFLNDLGFDAVSMITCQLGQSPNDVRYEYIYIYIYIYR